MALLAPQQVLVTGGAPAYTPASASDTVAPQGDFMLLHVKNTGGAIDNVSVVVPGTLYGQAIADVVIPVPATNGDRIILLPKELADPATGLITILHSVPAGATQAVFRW